MSSKMVKVSATGRSICVDPKKKIVTQCKAPIVGPTNKSSSLRPPLTKLGKRKRANECENKTLLKNYSNFMKSCLPQRLLFSQDGQWVDFSQEVVDLVREGFQSKRAAIEVKCNGCHFMVDVLYMTQVDLQTGAQKPIAWIDDAGKCVFPESYSTCHSNHKDLNLGESSEINVQLEIELNGLNNNEVEEGVGESDYKRVKVDQDLPKNNRAHPVEEKQKQKSDEYESPIFKTTCGTLDVETARNMFISGLGSDLKVDIFGVKKCSMEAQFELFQKQVEITQKLRGKANVQYGWFAASGGAPSGVMFYGHNGPKLGRYGYGIHLAAVQSAHLCTKICDDDENGLQHMVLCRVILGNVEVVQAGSKQFYPSEQCFDSGVDDLQNPNNYVIWNTNMNTHIFPEFVVSFKTSPTIKGNLVGEDSQTGKNGPEVMNLPSHEKVQSVGSRTPKEPKSPWVPFSMLFEAISTKVAPNDMKLLHEFHESYRAKKMIREEFIGKLKSVVGVQILRNALIVFQTKKVPNSASMPEAKEVQEG